MHHHLCSSQCNLSQQISFLFLIILSPPFFNLSNFARVSAPISYNYLKILSVKNSAFVSIVGAMDDVPLLGSANTYFFPILLVILIVFNALDLYSKILNSVGLKKFEFADSFDDRRIDQGKELISKGKSKKKKREKETNRERNRVNV